MKEKLRPFKEKALEAVRRFHEDETGMLVITRKIDQAIRISENIYVRILGIDRDRVKIGIDAPPEIPVLRQELLDRAKKTEKEQEQRTEKNSQSSKFGIKEENKELNLE